MKGSDEQDKQPQAEAASAAEGGNGSGDLGAAANPEAADDRASAGDAGPASEADLLRGELDQVKAELAERFDAFLRLQAEFENFKKRMYKEQGEQLKYAQLPLLRDLTQAMDNLDRALTHIRSQGSQEAQGLAGGLDLVAKQIRDTFEKFGMVRVKTEGAPFDPTRHEAVSVVETDQVPENHVLQEFQAGYLLHDRVVRPAMVSVSKRAGGASAGGGTGPAGA
jgi:molecular chaperone GrpE